MHFDLDGRRIRTVVYQHEDSQYVVTVGERRMRYRRRTGPRGGYIKNADYSSTGSPTGATVTEIVYDAAYEVIKVRSEDPPLGWSNPSLVGPSSLVDVAYFAD